jgi:hypothetical protein
VEDLTHLADLIRINNYVNGRISQIIGRPANTGALGEHIAAAFFDIDLHPNAVAKASDGIFRSGTFTGRTVNVKCYSRFGGLLDLVASGEPTAHPDTYLILAGPVPKSATTRGTQAPLVIASVYLFEAASLLNELLDRPKPLMPGIATSIRKHLWQAAMIYPEHVNQALVLRDEQIAALRLFAPQGGE